MIRKKVLNSVVELAGNLIQGKENFIVDTIIEDFIMIRNSGFRESDFYNICCDTFKQNNIRFKKSFKYLVKLLSNYEKYKCTMNDIELFILDVLRKRPHSDNSLFMKILEMIHSIDEE